MADWTVRVGQPQALGPAADVASMSANRRIRVAKVAALATVIAVGATACGVTHAPSTAGGKGSGGADNNRPAQARTQAVSACHEYYMRPTDIQMHWNRAAALSKSASQLDAQHTVLSADLQTENKLLPLIQQGSGNGTTFNPRSFLDASGKDEKVRRALDKECAALGVPSPFKGS